MMYIIDVGKTPKCQNSKNLNIGGIKCVRYTKDKILVSSTDGYINVYSTDFSLIDSIKTPAKFKDIISVDQMTVSGV